MSMLQSEVGSKAFSTFPLVLTKNTQAEHHLKAVNQARIEYALQLSDSNFTGLDYTLIDLAGLRVIAADCPRSGGPGVFDARVFLSMADTLKIHYQNPCEHPDAVSQGSRVARTVLPEQTEEGSEHDFDFLHENLSKESMNNEVLLIPNPGRDELMIQVPDTYQNSNLQIEIISSKGELVYQQKVQNTQGILVPSRLWSAGLYLVKIGNELGQVQHLKWVKQ